MSTPCYIEVDPDFILENCIKILSSIEDWKEKTIREEYSKWVGKKVGFIFKRTINTIEEAIEYDESHQEFGCGSEKFWIELTANNKSKVVVKMQSAAILAQSENKPFYASVDDYHYFIKLLGETK